MRRGSAILAAVLVLCAASAVLPATGAAAAPCPGAATPAVDGSLVQAARGVLCLVDRERVRHGRRPLVTLRTLSLASRSKARAMIAERRFAHRSRDGTGIADRIFRAGHRPSGSWLFGENLAWGTGRGSTPQAVVHAWMESPSHRANLLRRRFRAVGVFVERGLPVPWTWPGATFVLHLSD
jgi:uncharacterized protein YkwD